MAIMKKLLLVRLEVPSKKKISVSQQIIQHKALNLYEDLTEAGRKLSYYGM
jgi:hypothetical protein